MRDFIFIDDVVDVLIAAAGYDGPDRVFNVGSGIGRTIQQIVADISFVLDRYIEIVHKPVRAVDVPLNVLDIKRVRYRIGMDAAGRVVGWAASHGLNG